MIQQEKRVHEKERDRNGLLVGVRNADHQLVSNCFERVWSDPEDRLWLTYNLPLLVLTDSWYLIEFVKRIEAVPEDKKKSVYRRFLGIMTDLVKSRDVSALSRIYMLSKITEVERLFDSSADRESPWLTHREYELINAHVNLGPDSLLGAADRELTDYERKVWEYILERAMSRTTVKNLYLCFTALVLLITRGLPRDDIQAQIDKVKTRALPDPNDDRCPWTCLSPGSLLGDRILNEIKREDIRIDVLFGLWSMEFEKAKTRPVKIRKDPTWLQTQWYDPMIKYSALIHGKSWDYTIEIWEKELKPLIQSRVESIMTEEGL